MSYATPLSDDLATFLGADVSVDRGALLISLAEKLCRGVVSALPDGAEAVVLDVVSRAYSNPQNLQQATTGPYSASYGAVSGGLWLTRQNKATLRSLAGGGGAFTIDPTPADAGPGNYWQQLPESVTDIISSPPFYGDFDEGPSE